MKKKIFYTPLIFIFFCFVSVQAAAQKMIQVRVDCFTSNKNRGDAYANAKNYDMAIQQYQNAKYCNALSVQQRRLLDSLIIDCNKKKAAMQKKVIVRTKL